MENDAISCTFLSCPRAVRHLAMLAPMAEVEMVVLKQLLWACRMQPLVIRMRVDASE